jgi:hypothetical protein
MSLGAKGLNDLCGPPVGLKLVSPDLLRVTED